MMKTIPYVLFTMTLLVGCSTAQESVELKPKIGSPNPASQYCIEQGGKLEMRSETNGQVGYCHLEDGQVIEEWKLLKESQNVCNADKAKALVGKLDLTDQNIQQFTQSEIVRRVASGQPVTMDYRENRVTVMVDPVSKKITQASCG